MGATIMHFSSLIVLAFLVGLYAAYIKLATKIMKRVHIRWMNCFIFAGTVTVVSYLAKVVSAMSGFSLPSYFGLFYILIVNAGFGAVYFGRYGSTPEGGQLGWQRGLKLGLLIFGLLVLTFLLLELVLILTSVITRR
jgi:hypothetical protein